MERDEVIRKAKEIVDQHGSLEVSWTDPRVAEILPLLKTAKVRSELARDHDIICTINVGSQTVRLNRSNNAAFGSAPAAATAAKPADVKPFMPTKRTQHTYIPPHFDSDVKTLLKDVVPHNLWFTGPTGSGKTEYVHHLSNELGLELYKEAVTIYQVNGRHDMESAGFLGDKTIDIDPKTCQNYIAFLEGPVVKAMRHGLDKEGNEVGPPAWLFIDEVAALPSHILIALNRVLETRKVRREVNLDADGGRLVKSHSGFRIICAGNTIGRGFTDMASAMYTAQGDALDISTLNRFSATFKFGYNKKAEKNILMEKTGDDRVTAQILKFRDAIRGFIKQGKLSTPFSTRTIVALADLFRLYGKMSKALYFGVFNSLPKEEKQVYNEQWMSISGVDVLKDCENQNDMDYMD
jgi:MoxR-like ATPase